MSAHLLLVTLGPVQDFIAQARRTRDLWYGSHLLSELSRVAARTLVDGGAQLIFPALKQGDSQLQSCAAPIRPDGTSPLNVSNKILAQSPSGIEPATLAEKVREAVAKHWREDLAAAARSNCAGLLAPGIDAVWTEQVNTLLDYSACWLPLEDYSETRLALEQASAGRKMLRDFGPWTQLRGGVPKSSLDGARETVLRPPETRPADLVRKYRIATGEQLDAIGLVKRTGGEPEQFVPVVNIALASWLELAANAAPAELNSLSNSCKKIDLARVTRSDLPCAATFGFDASILLPNRWRRVFEELGIAGDPLSWGRTHVMPLLDRITEPYPYVACLVADGDHMGQATNRLKTSTEHQVFSTALSEFATSARSVVEQEHRGGLIYAGGDDVLAFLPLPTALACADALRASFSTHMNTAFPSLPVEERPTLSVGIGIGHLMESMGDLLALGREAERGAKRDRNSLALLIDKRSGSTRRWQAPWHSDPVQTLQEAATLLFNRLSTSKVYEIARILDRLPAPSETAAAGWANVLEMEVRRVLARNEGGGMLPEEAGLAIEAQASYARLHAQVREWISCLLIGRTFMQAEPRERVRSRAGAA